MITIIKYGPPKQEMIVRDIKRICTYIRINENRGSEFYCNNICEPYKFIFPPMAEPKKFWITQSMICSQCLVNLQKTYNINFEKEIIKTFLYKQWNSTEIHNYKNYSLIKSLKSKIKINSKSKLDPELAWWNKHDYLLGIPIYWLKNFILHDYFLKGSKKQGKFNGPDYIFKDIKNNKLIGFEISSYKWNLINSFREIEQAKKFAKKKIFHSTCFNDQVEELKKYIDNKSSKKYIECDEIYLGIVVSNTLVDWEYFVLEVILNEYIKKNNKTFNGVFIL
ncbi:MAG: hypothetical protein ACRC9U_03420 [Metamycoplasmataceae bacterium]